MVIGRNYNLDQPDRVIREFEDTIFGQDQVVVESQRPERVPFDLAAELHLRFDAVAVAYRKAMRDSGWRRGPRSGRRSNSWGCGPLLSRRPARSPRRPAPPSPPGRA